MARLKAGRRLPLIWKVDSHCILEIFKREEDIKIRWESFRKENARHQ
jgi:hypothetical protein